MSYLRFGSRVRPDVVVDSSCVEPRDPGFESGDLFVHEAVNQLASTAVGLAEPWFVHWRFERISATAEISTANPYSGSRHLRLSGAVHDFEAVTWTVQPVICPGNLDPAFERQDSYGGPVPNRFPVSMVATPGKTYEIQARVSATPEFGTINVFHNFVRADGFFVAPGGSGGTAYDDPDGTYQLLTHSATAPEGTAYIVASVEVMIYEGVVVDIDDFSVSEQ